jgi:hypothetical protein
MHKEIPQNTQEAVELGLYLAITADTDEKSADALQLAKDLALDLSPAEMEGAKANVRKFIADERLHSQMMKSAKEPKRLTRAAIIDAIGCPNLVLERVKHRDVLVGEHTVGFAFSYLKEGMYGDYEVLGQLEVNYPRLKDLTLKQWVEHGQKLVDEVKLRRDLSSAIEAVSPSETPFMTKGRDVNLNDWET